MGRVNVISDDRTPGKLDLLIEGLNQQGIVDYKIWEAIIDRKTVTEAINASFKMVVQDAKDRCEKECIIMEDDCYFPAKDGWQYFLKNKPADFDIYISGNYLIHEPEHYKEPLLKVKAYVGNHCIIISEKYYDTFLATPDELHIDTEQSGKGDFYVCYPFAALQRPGFSTNNKAMVNYNAILKQEWVYGTLHNV